MSSDEAPEGEAWAQLRSLIKEGAAPLDPVWAVQTSKAEALAKKIEQIVGPHTLAPIEVLNEGAVAWKPIPPSLKRALVYEISRCRELQARMPEALQSLRDLMIVASLESALDRLVAIAERGALSRLADHGEESR